LHERLASGIEELKMKEDRVTDPIEWPENQILIPDWTYFHCPDTTLAGYASSSPNTNSPRTSMTDAQQQANHFTLISYERLRLTIVN